MELIKKENETYRDIQLEEFDSTLDVPAIDEDTHKGVDPNDPEEIARIDHLNKLLNEFGPYFHSNRSKIAPSNKCFKSVLGKIFVGAVLLKRGLFQKKSKC